MKQKILTMVMMAAMVAASVSMTSCGGGGDDDLIPSEYVGTWTCNQYFYKDDIHTIYSMYAKNGYPPTLVAINSDGTCSGSGMVINGSGTCTIKQGDKRNDDYWAIITFYQNGKVVNRVTVESFTNDHLSGDVILPGHEDKLFIFKK